LEYTIVAGNVEGERGIIVIRKKESTAILQSLGGGVVPRVGLEHIIVGRKRELEHIMKELQTVKEGASIVKFIIGDYGSGKSFLLSVIRHIAFKMKFVVCDADFTPERRMYGSDRKAVATYSECMRNLATATKPDGGALSTILEKWIDQQMSKVAVEMGAEQASLDDPEFVRAVQNAVFEQTAQMEALVGGYDFARVIHSYIKGYLDQDTNLMSNALRWLRGEYATKTEARQDLGVRTIIDDDNYYDYFKIISEFVASIGYSGLVILLDEAINLYKITHPQTREKNYEKILSIFNDSMQGKSQHMYIAFGGTHEFLENERKGLFSYPALKSRLTANRFESEQFRDLNQPVIRLSPLKLEETFVLVQKIRDIHEAHYEYTSGVTDAQIEQFLKGLYGRPGAEEFLTPREIVRDFIGGLNILQQNPTMDRQAVFAELVSEATQKQESIFSRFQSI
jgi:P-loop Domain of unknown function (DUF2791)